MFNQFNFEGRLTKDPELRSAQSGKSVATFTVACDRDKKDADCDFFRCVAWERNAEFASRWFKKGDPIIITGRLQMNNYTAKDGTNRTEYEVIVERMRFPITTAKPAEPATTTKFAEVEDDGALPF